MSDLTDRIAEVQRRHVSAQTENWETKLRCECGQGEFSSKLEYSRHVAERITDLLIDLAGTGQLLSSIDQIGRAAPPGRPYSAFNCPDFFRRRGGFPPR